MKKELKYALILTAIYALVVGVTAYFHEPWRDEAQAWLIARDLSFFGMLDQMSMEGQPALWHIILFPFAHLGFPFQTIQVIAFVIAVAMVFLFTRYAPFRWPTKLLIILSFYFVVPYAVTARSYGLGVLLLFAILAIWQKRFSNPLLFGLLVALLANANTHSAFIAAVIGVIYLYDIIKQSPTRLQIAGACLMVLGGVVCLLTGYPDPNTSFSLFGSAPEILFKFLSTAIFPDHFFPLEIKIPVGITIWILLILGLVPKPKALFFLLASVASLGYIMAFWSPGGPRHWGLFLIVLLAALWLSTFEPPWPWLKKKRRLYRPLIIIHRASLILLTGTLILAIVFTGFFIKYEIALPYSNGKAMAEYLQENYPDRLIAAYPSPFSAPISAFAPDLRIWHLYKFDLGTYVEWNYDQYYTQNLPLIKALLLTVGSLPEKDALFLLTVPLEDNPYVHLIHKENIPGFVGTNEVYYLYEIQNSDLQGE